MTHLRCGEAQGDAERWNGVFDYRRSPAIRWVWGGDDVIHVLKNERFSVVNVWCDRAVESLGQPDRAVDPCPRCVVAAVQESDWHSAIRMWWRDECAQGR